MHLLFLKMLFPSNAKVNFDEYSKLFQGDYERISLNPYTVRGKKVTKYYITFLNIPQDSAFSTGGRPIFKFK